MPNFGLVNCLDCYRIIRKNHCGVKLQDLNTLIEQSQGIKRHKNFINFSAFKSGILTLKLFTTEPLLSAGLFLPEE